MNEILCHPWVTYTELPMYIDHKLAENKLLFYKRRTNRSLTNVYRRLRKLSDQSKEIETESKILKAIAEDPNDSFLIGVRIGTAEEMEQTGQNKRRQKRHDKDAKSDDTSINCQNQYTFTLLKNIFEDKDRLEKFAKTFQEFTLRNQNLYLKNAWKTGFSFSLGLRRLVKKFVQVSNKLKIKLSVVNAQEFRFRCILLDSLGGPSDRTFLLQIYEFYGDYVFDFRNETVPKLAFLLVCFNIYRLGTTS